MIGFPIDENQYEFQVKSALKIKRIDQISHESSKFDKIECLNGKNF
jgi:hypothetical protein